MSYVLKYQSFLLFFFHFSMTLNFRDLPRIFILKIIYLSKGRVCSQLSGSIDYSGACFIVKLHGKYMVVQYSHECTSCLLGLCGTNHPPVECLWQIRPESASLCSLYSTFYASLIQRLA